MLRWRLQIGHDRFRNIPSKLTVHKCPIIQPHRVKKWRFPFKPGWLLYVKDALKIDRCIYLPVYWCVSMILGINRGDFPLQYYTAGNFIGDEVHFLWREMKFLWIILCGSNHTSDYYVYVLKSFHAKWRTLSLDRRLGIRDPNSYPQHPWNKNTAGNYVLLVL